MNPDILLHVLLALAAVIVAGQLLGRLFVRIGQPPVIGEVVAGILLGPSLLGRAWPDGMHFLLPERVLPFLSVLAQLGVILYMFVVGLELDLGHIRHKARTAAFISQAGIVVPFTLGLALALVLYPEFAGEGVPFLSFGLFSGIAMSVTAFPVLARILTDRGLATTPLGTLALTCAAVDDVTAWCLLAAVVGVARAEMGAALLTGGLVAAYLFVMFVAVRPVLRWVTARYEEGRHNHAIISGLFVAVLLSAAATEAIGIHAIFGAFLLGALVPHDSALAQSFTRTLREIVTVLLLPAFFAFTGMRTQIGLVSTPDQWLVCGLIILVATAGKFGGTFLTAWLLGHSRREASALGVLMNTRGLMELIVLNVGLDLGVISPTLFAMMVLMALVTTLATSPFLGLFERPRNEEATTPSRPGSVAASRAAPLGTEP